MSEVSILAIPALVNVAHGEHVQLLLAIAAGDVDGEEDGPGYAGADEHNDHGHLEEAEEEVGIERLVLERVGIGDFPKWGDPVEPPGRERLGSFSVAMSVRV